MLITVGNLRQTKDGLRCDRESSLGSPFVLMVRSDTVGRLNSVKAYGFYLYYVTELKMEPIEAIEAVYQKFKMAGVHLIVSQAQRPTRDQFMEGIYELESILLSGKSLTLLCWCDPDPCHCHRIRSYLQWRFDKFTQTLAVG
jgi:hypothetical protein